MMFGDLGLGFGFKLTVLRSGSVLVDVYMIFKL